MADDCVRPTRPSILLMDDFIGLDLCDNSWLYLAWLATITVVRSQNLIVRALTWFYHRSQDSPASRT
ncbi:hypothetical protein PCASD_22846 [Puccinia coronata f. sp. avenae]|uniref:Uncharacterized protein n=1 Tax=Puccinia coronata f. sp. avenae TaxID=200324 RepID=A0A2N5S8U8_9BASI|nr:hypothetical protein PCASD_22846 [Puccinia coronata f. sp. avenae]